VNHLAILNIFYIYMPYNSVKFGAPYCDTHGY